MPIDQRALYIGKLPVRFCFRPFIEMINALDRDVLAGRTTAEILPSLKKLHAAQLARGAWYWRRSGRRREITVMFSANAMARITPSLIEFPHSTKMTR